MAPFDQHEPKSRQADSVSQSGYDGLERNSEKLFSDRYRAASDSRSQKNRRTSQRSSGDASLAIYISIVIVTAAVVIIDAILS